MNPCLEPLAPHKHLSAVQTAQDQRTLYDSVSFCNRCGACMQGCASYPLLHRETFSPRGRNQLLRLALEGKIKLTQQDKQLREALASCTLCGRCYETCAGQVQTPEHVLEMRRALRLRLLPGTLFFGLQLREDWPGLFNWLTRTALLLRRVGFVKLVRLSQLTKLSGLNWINYLDDILPSRIPSLRRALRQSGRKAQPKEPRAIYVPSLEAEFILPDIAQQTLSLLEENGPAAVWFNTASGLFSYVYGDLQRSRRTLRRFIKKHLATGNGNLPVLTDSIDVYLFLKRAPQVFFGNEKWESHARNLADCTRFVTDYISPDSATEQPDSHPPVQLERSALFERQAQPFLQAQKILATLFGKNFVQCLYTDADMPAFGYMFAVPQKRVQLALRTVEKIARAQTKEVVTLSGLAALELNFWLKKFYPAAKATHFVHVNRLCHAKPHTRARAINS